MNKISLQLHEVTVKRSGAEKPDVDSISCAFAQGEFVALCGANGAGKSTLLRTIAGLYPLAGGWIECNGERVLWGHNLAVHMLFQPASAQLLGDTVFEELAVTFLQQNQQSTRGELTMQVQAALNLVRLHVPPDTSVRQLSGGQLQRLCIAGALASGAEVLLIDEGLSDVDPAATIDLRNQLREVARSGRTVLLVSHDMEDLLSTDRVLVIDGGRLVANVSTTEFFYSNQTETPTLCLQHGFQPPYLVQVAMEWNRLHQHNSNFSPIHPLTESDWLEVLARGTNHA